VAAVSVLVTANLFLNEIRRGGVEGCNSLPHYLALDISST
jgi:hypothetical protein